MGLLFGAAFGFLVLIRWLGCNEGASDKPSLPSISPIGALVGSTCRSPIGSGVFSNTFTGGNKKLLGMALGSDVGSDVGALVGLRVGVSDASLGLVDGLSVGLLVGDSVASLGLTDGVSVGFIVGVSEASLGLVDGLSVGLPVGVSEASLGRVLGLALGSSPRVALLSPKASSVILNAPKLSSSSS